MKGMRLLMTADAVGGVWEYALELSAALPQDVAVTLAVLGPAPGDAQRAAAAAVPGLRLVETGLPLDWLSDNAGPVLQAGEAVATLAREVGADLVHLNMPTLAASGAFDLPVLAVTHGCLATWWDAAGKGAMDACFAWHPALSARGLATAGRVLAPSRAYARTIARRYGLQTVPSVVHNGRTPLPLPGGPATPFHGAITVGRLWDEVKGAHVLDATAGLLGAPFVAIGATCGPHGERFEPAHLDAIGVLPPTGLGAWLARRPVFVSGASFEPFGLAVLEAAQAGCPLVLSDIPTFRELWDGAAMFVPCGDAQGFADAIAALLADEGAFGRLSQAAQVRSAAYRPEAMAAQTHAHYRELLASRPDGSRRAA